MTTYTDEIDSLVKDWFRRCRESQMVHYEYASKLSKRHITFGCLSMVFSTIVGTAVFSYWESSANSESVRILLGMLSVTAATLAALQTFLNYAEKTANHKNTGALYGALRRDLELLKTIPPVTSEEMSEKLIEFKSMMDKLALDSPGVPSKFKKIIDKRLKIRNHERVINLYSSDAD
ncbi:SLATT domain-containing protein [Reinekea sp.]|jgi:hypothetical protein|uniref:SLATT domain-containing protein n=1 Tax=Reinekea sp. TaxID=1970455 RepID=UPI003989CD95